MTLARRLRPELMDDPALDSGEHAKALAALARLNRVSRIARGMWREIHDLMGRSKSVRLLDVATGSADVPIEIARLARRDGVRLELTACDESERALGHAQARADRAGLPIALRKIDATKEELPGVFDVATCSLFLHHLTTENATRVLTSMAKAAPIVIANDLERSRRGVTLAWATTKLLSSSRVVRTDAVLSYEAAFTREELTTLARNAGLDGAIVRPAFPFRMLLIWKGPNVPARA